MKTNSYVSPKHITLRMALFVLIVAAALLTPAAAQQAAPVVSSSSAALSALPASDMVITINLRRIMTEALPRLMVNAPLTRAKMNTELDKMKAQTGFDIRSVDRIVMGMGDLNISSGMKDPLKTMPGKFIAIMSGNFNAGVLIATARLAMNGKYQEEQYGGKTLYTFAVDDKTGQTAGTALNSSNISVTALGDHAIAIGLPNSVRAAIDLQTGMGTSPTNANLLALEAANNTNALFTISADVQALSRRAPVAATRTRKGLQLDPLDKLATPSPAAGAPEKDEITKALESITQIFFSAGMTANEYNLNLSARTSTAEDAKKIEDMLMAVQNLASSAKDPKAQRILQGIKLTSDDSGLQMRADFTQADVASIFTDKNFKTGETPALVSPGPAQRRTRTTTRTTTRSTRSTVRRKG